MKGAIFIVQPSPGKILQVYLRCRRVDFLDGFCRGVLHVGKYVQFLEGFRRRSDPGMTVLWSEPHDFGLQPRERFSVELADEAPWMSLTEPPQISH